MLQVLKQWIPEVMCMKNSGHLLKTESTWQLAKQIIENILSYLWHSISVNCRRKSSYPGRSNGSYKIGGVHFHLWKGQRHLAGEPREWQNHEKVDTEALENLHSSAFAECTSACFRRTQLYLPTVLSEKEKGVHVLLTENASRPRGAGSPEGCELVGVGWTLVRKNSETWGNPQT